MRFLCTEASTQQKRLNFTWQDGGQTISWLHKMDVFIRTNTYCSLFSPTSQQWNKPKHVRCGQTCLSTGQILMPGFNLPILDFQKILTFLVKLYQLHAHAFFA